jgi:hypothetical protein
LFCRVDPASVTGLPNGAPYGVQANHAVLLGGLEKIEGSTSLPFYTFRSDERLKNSYLEIAGLEALRMALKCEGIDGLLFQNKRDSGVVLKTDQIKLVLSKFSV